MSNRKPRMDTEDFGIWPPYEAFYIESMLLISSSAVEYSQRLSTIFDNQADLKNITSDDVLDWLQNIIIQAAALSRYFWPTKNRDKELDKLHKKRGRHLCKAFGMNEKSPLKNRNLRNQIEHFDENMDIFFAKSVAGNFIPKYVGRIPKDGEVTTYIFRAFYTDVGIFEVLGKRYKVQPIVDEIYRIHNKLVGFAAAGYRMKKTENKAT